MEAAVYVRPAQRLQGAANGFEIVARHNPPHLITRS